jgi:H+/Cl- antiporter ClcA
MEKTTKLIGHLALILGIASASLTGFFLLKPIPFAIFLAILCGLFGFITSSAYVMLNLRYQVNEKKLTPGLLGLFLSSAPVVYILLIKALH